MGPSAVAGARGSSACARRSSVTVPRGAEPGQAIHLIVEGTDTGSPALTRYQRVVLKVV